MCYISDISTGDNKEVIEFRKRGRILKVRRMAPDGAASGPEREEGSGAGSALVDCMEDLDPDAAIAECRLSPPVVYDEVENFYLQSGATAVSIMQLPLCVGSEIISKGDGLEEVCLVGQSTSESREIRVLAEKWKLDLQPNSPPTFLVKTACGWIRVQKPKVVYKRFMTDGLTLAHFLHFVRKHPSATANATREYLTTEFRKLGENPSLERLSDFFPVIGRYMEADTMMKNLSTLRDFFPGHFSDHVVVSCTVGEIDESKRSQDDKLPASTGCTIDLNQAILEEHEKQGVKSTSNSKATAKAQRAIVQAELRNLHSQWCTLLGGRATVKADKKAVEKKSASKKGSKGSTSGSQNSVKRKVGRPKSASKKSDTQTSPSKTFNLEDGVPKKGQPSDQKKPQSRKRRASELETAVSKKGNSSHSRRRHLSSLPSLESKNSILDQRGKSKLLTKALTVELTEEKTMDLNSKKSEIKQPPLLDTGSWAPGPSRVIMGVHSPSTDLFDRLEDPPICTICDDGGDLICCEGPCQRHFHATPGADTPCQTLGLTKEQVKRIDKYYCKNCLLKQHQCFLCLELGYSAPSSLGRQEVYLCDAPGCRKFYHAGCVAKALDPESRGWKAVAERIERGLHGFLCPRHTCAVCTTKEIQPGIFVQCRRCPKAWHRECLTDFSFSGELPTTLIWKHYDREFVYCKKHKILPDILTPAQDHLKFPKEER